MKRLRIVSALALLALVVVSAATAASPSDIYADYADNGRLDQNYSDSDLRNALTDAAVQGYGKPTVTPGMRGEIEEQLGRREHGHPGRGHGRLTVDAALHGRRPGAPDRGCGFLLLLGLGFRRLGRARS